MKRIFLLFVLPAALFAQIPNGSAMFPPSKPAQNTAAAIPAVKTAADKAEDLRSLQEDVKTLELRLDDLQRQNDALQSALTQAKPDLSGYATQEDLKLAETRLKNSISSESVRIQGVILDEIKSAQAKASLKPAGIPAAAPIISAPAGDPLVDKLTAPVTDSEKKAFLSEGIRYTVAPGDTLSSIAHRNHSSMRAIVVANGLTDPNHLLVGRELFIPTLP